MKNNSVLLNRIVLVISVHPDDETLGCGGTILKHIEQGDSVYWLIITNINNEITWGKERIEERQNEIKIVEKGYGIKQTILLNYDTTKLDQIPIGELTIKIVECIRKIKPEIIYLHNRSDVHTDHKISFDAIISATKTFNNSYIKKMLMYETISETEYSPALQENAFVPNYFVDVSEFIWRKVEIMKVYKTEIKEHPFPRSEKNILALATFRGAQAGTDYAEGFMILKEIWK